MIKVNVVRAGQALFDGVGLYLSNWEFEAEKEPSCREELIAASILAVLEHIKSQVAIPGFSLTETDTLPEVGLDVERMTHSLITKVKGL